MRKYVLLALAAVLVITALVMAGCGHGSSSVAEFNGKAISYEEYAKQVAMTRDGQSTLSQIFATRMMRDLAEKNGVAPTDDQINTRLEFAKKINGGDVELMLKQQNMTMDEWKDQQKSEQSLVNLADKLAKNKVTDADVKAQYDRTPVFNLPERMRTDIAQFTSSDAADKAAKAVEGGASMEKAAGAQGGQSATQFLPKAGLPQDIDKAVWGTEKGKVSSVVKMPGNMMNPSDVYYIFKPVSTVPAVKISQKEAEPVLKAQLYQQKLAGDTDFQKTIADARKDAKITINLPVLKPSESLFRNPPPPPTQGMPMMPKGKGAPKAPPAPPAH